MRHWTARKLPTTSTFAKAFGESMDLLAAALRG